MTFERRKEELPFADEIGVPDYGKISPADFDGLNSDGEIGREVLRHFEAYQSEQARLLQEEYDRLDEEVRNALSNREKVELDIARSAVKAKIDALGVISVEDEVIEDEPTDEVPEVGNDSPVEKLATEAGGEQVKEEPSEHWKLKEAMRDAKQAYLGKLEADVEQRGALKKMFGFGQKEMTPEVLEAYNKFMAANQAYYHYADESGRYKKINEWLQDRQEKAGQAVEPMGIYGAVANRHVLKPASERLALQERQMPPAVLKLFKTIGGNSYLKWGLLGTSVIATAGGSLFGILGGKATKWGLERTYVRGKIDQHKVEAREITNVLAAHELIDLDLLEKEYFASGLAIDTARFRTNAASMAVGAAATAGAGYTIGTIGSEFLSEGVNTSGGIVDGTVKPISPNDLGLVVESAPTASPVGSTSEVGGNATFNELVAREMNFGGGSIEDQLGIKEVSSYDTDTFTNDALKAAAEVEEKSVATLDTAIEKVVTVKPGDTMSELLYDTIKERVAAGQLTLPSGQSISQYLYQNFPELTNATDVAGRLTPEEWVKLGVESGNPNQIAVGEVIDINALLEKLPSATSETVASSPVDTVVADTTSNSVAGAETTTSSPPGTPPKVAESIEATTDVSSSRSEVNIVSKSAILQSRVGPDVMLTQELIAGYQPQMSPEFSKSVTTFSESINKNSFTYELYRQTLEAYQGGNINLPAETVRKVAADPLALATFLDNNAAEFSDHNPLFSRSALSLTPEGWRELGFSSGDPTVIKAGDTIKTGELVKLILENAARKINGKLPV